MDILHLSTCGFFKDLVFFLEFFLCPFVKVMTFLWILRSIFQIAVSQKISFLHDFRMNDQWQVSKKIHKPDPKVSNEEQIFQKSRSKFDWNFILYEIERRITKCKFHKMTKHERVEVEGVDTYESHLHAYIVLSLLNYFSEC